MISIDTNIIVRYLTGDDAEQSAKAREIVDREDVLVGVTVLLEAAWVLRSLYGFPERRVVMALRGFAGLSRVSVEDAATVAQAFAWVERGLDFADALHLARSAGCEAFVTFDRRFVREATKLGTMAVRTP